MERRNSLVYDSNQVEVELFTGKHLCKYENGQKKSEGVKKEGKFFTGLYTEWSDQGVKVLEGAYEQWGKHGIWRGYDDFGNKVFEEYYQNGDIIRSTTF